MVHGYSFLATVFPAPAHRRRMVNWHFFLYGKFIEDTLVYLINSNVNSTANRLQMTLHNWNNVFVFLCSMLQWAAVHSGVLRCIAVSGGALRYVAVRCGMLQCVAVRCRGPVSLHESCSADVCCCSNLYHCCSDLYHCCSDLVHCCSDLDHNCSSSQAATMRVRGSRILT